MILYRYMSFNNDIYVNIMILIYICFNRYMFIIYIYVEDMLVIVEKCWKQVY